MNGKYADYKALLDYRPNNSSIDNVRICDYLLAKAFPARTRPMGSTEADIDNTGFAENFDMASGGANGLMLHGWPRSERYAGKLQWWHSDYKDVAYIYVQELYKKWVELSR